jgi:hypothetical protein
MGGSYARTLLPQSLTTTTYNDANHLTQRGAATLTYDDEGNLTSDGVNTYTWNARNQLSAISGSVNASFQYEGFARRVSKRRWQHSILPNGGRAAVSQSPIIHL